MTLEKFILNKLNDMDAERGMNGKGNFMCRSVVLKELSIEDCFVKEDTLVLGFTDGTTQEMEIMDFNDDWDNFKFEIEAYDGDMAFLF